MRPLPLLPISSRFFSSSGGPLASFSIDRHRLLRQILADKSIPATQSNEPVSLSSMSFISGTFKERRRVGRSRTGRFCGRGNGGQKSQSGNKIPRLFEGGAQPFHRKVPKYGNRAIFHRPKTVISLNRIQLLIDSGRLDPTAPITPRTLAACGTPPRYGVEIEAANMEEFCTPGLRLVANRIPPDAIAKIEELGGLPIAMHLTRFSLFTLVRQAAKRSHMRYSAPIKESDKLFYFSLANRGYLHPSIWARIQKDPQLWDSIFSRAVHIPPRPGILEKISMLERRWNKGE